jgi:phage-related protein (TIGR01555 family)
MLRFLRSLLRRKEPVPPARASRADKYDLASAQSMLARQREATQRQVDAFLRAVQDAPNAIRIEKDGALVRGGAMDAMDSSDTGLPCFKGVNIASGQALMAMMPWFMQQGFIGYQNAAFIAQHWLVYKACATPVDDAIRNGYDITTSDGDDLDEDVLKILRKADRKVGITGQLRDFGTKGRIFGVRIAMFMVESDDPEYYEKPYNPDGVKPGTYRGISQVDPYWTAPILDMDSSGVPSSKHFYEPTWWLIGSRRVHRSHLVIFRYADPPDVLKPLYLFGGIPLPQMIMERVYCAERTANEAPALALSKRTTVWLTDMEKAMADSQKTDSLMSTWIAFRDNFGIKLGDKEGDEFQQFDTPLADFDQLVMTQYGLVAATAGMPITKLLGTTPGGFAATGEYDESSYHELLESMEERDFTPFVARHHELVMLSDVIPKYPELKGTEITVKWHELDAMTHKEQAEVNLSKAQTDTTLIAGGALTAEDSRKRIASDKESGYHGIGIDLEREEIPSDDDPEAAAEASRGGRYGAKADVEARAEAKTEGNR